MIEALAAEAAGSLFGSIAVDGHDLRELRVGKGESPTTNRGEFCAKKIPVRRKWNRDAGGGAPVATGYGGAVSLGSGEDVIRR